jgi:hypothetical protein
MTGLVYNKLKKKTHGNYKGKPKKGSIRTVGLQAERYR